MNNRRWNCHNDYQGKAKRVLCVCSAGLLRSPTCANTLHKEYGYNTRACGLDVNYALIPIDEVLVEWADEIVCMDGYQEEEIRRVYKTETPIVNLHINDSFEYMDKTLIAQILERYPKV